MTLFAGPPASILPQSVFEPRWWSHLQKCRRKEEEREEADASVTLPFRNSAVSHYTMLVAQLCQTLCDPMDCSPPGFSVHGILQARILEGVAIPFSRRSSWPRDQPWSPALQADFLPLKPPGKPWLPMMGTEPWLPCSLQGQPWGRFIIYVSFSFLRCTPSKIIVTNFPGGFIVKGSTWHCRRHEMWVWPLGREDPLEEGMATHSSLLAWRIPGTKEPGGLYCMRW